MATVLDSHFLALTAIVTVVYQLLFFVVTALLKFDKVTDFAGSTNFVIIALLTLILKGTWHFRQVVLTTFVVIWGLRLGLFLLMRILKWGEDRRFDEMRSNFGKLTIFWIFQAVWVWTVSLPVTVVNASNRDPPLQAQDIVGWIMWFLGFLVEAVADQQKLNFKNSPENRGKWCNSGLWSYSRHPNYFGEESADKKYGNVASYRTYKRTTSPLILLPPSIYGNLPQWVKTSFLFEFPLYSRNLPDEGVN
ncbi:hypothetical protein BT93_B0611 [Corymbia citriodora subsp. variegata]|nr:hypothetical protein BT93_B0611 [Corymbia citriodora subsp. variegata]